MSLGDPAFVNTAGPLGALLSKNYVDTLRRRTSDDSVLPVRDYGGIYNAFNATQPKIDHGTSHFSILDR